MKKIADKNKQGFTIIEVVLVLAIAALIFLMVFIALPALQRSQRNTQRRDDMSRFSSQIAQYQSNNRGKVPDSDDDWGTQGENGDNATGFIANYMRASGDVFEDPDGFAYKITDHGDLDSNYKGGGDSKTMSLSNLTATTTYDEDGNVTGITSSTVSGSSLDHTIHVLHKAHCEGEGAAYSSGSRNLAFLYQLEGTGVYCGTN